jgi:hypothetical protein
MPGRGGQQHDRSTSEPTVKGYIVARRWLRHDGLP